MGHNSPGQRPFAHNVALETTPARLILGVAREFHWLVSRPAPLPEGCSVGNSLSDPNGIQLPGVFQPLFCDPGEAHKMALNTQNQAAVDSREIGVTGVDSQARGRRQFRDSRPLAGADFEKNAPLRR